MLKVNCKDCFYRKLLAYDFDCHVWGEDCDHYDDDLCQKMNDPDFIEYMKKRGDEHGKETPR
jgi:hypothetical protein